jgi:hypothetical protein
MEIAAKTSRTWILLTMIFLGYYAGSIQSTIKIFFISEFLATMVNYMVHGVIPNIRLCQMQAFYPDFSVGKNKITLFYVEKLFGIRSADNRKE